MKALDCLMSRLGYVPAPVKLAPSIIKMELDFEINSAPVDAAIAKLDQLGAAARTAEAAITDALVAQEGEFITAELVADETPGLILAELRKQTTLLEVLAKQGDRVAACAAPATGAAASGLPG